jgi:uncharacterized protein (TIGR03086 family)
MALTILSSLRRHNQKHRVHGFCARFLCTVSVHGYCARFLCSFCARLPFTVVCYRHAMSEQVIQRMQTLIAGFDARVQAAPRDAWTNQSPCEEWKARDVVAHVANNYLRVGGALTDQEFPPVADDEDIVAAWNRGKDAILTGLTQDLSKSLEGPMGPMTAADMLGRFIANDTLVHTWDLARSVGGDEQLPSEIVAGAFAGLKPMDQMIRGPGVFGNRIDVDENADEQTKFLSFLGRKV